MKLELVFFMMMVFVGIGMLGFSSDSTINGVGFLLGVCGITFGMICIIHDEFINSRTVIK